MDYKEIGEMLRRVRQSVVTNGSVFASEDHMSSKSVYHIEKGSRCELTHG